MVCQRKNVIRNSTRNNTNTTRNFLSVIPVLSDSFDISSLVLAAVVSLPLYWLLAALIFAAALVGVSVLWYLRGNHNQEEGTMHTLEHLREGKKSKIDARDVQKKQEHHVEIPSTKKESPVVQEKKDFGIFNVSSFLKRERATQSLAHSGRNSGTDSQKTFSLKALADAGFSVPTPSEWNGTGTMIPDARLLKYVRDARKFGMTDQEITQELLRVGWDTAEINNTLSYT